MASAKSISSSSDKTSGTPSEDFDGQAAAPSPDGMYKVPGVAGTSPAMSLKDEQQERLAPEAGAGGAASDMAVQDGALYARTWFVQFAVLWKRSFMYQLRNPAIAAMRLFFSNVFGILVGLLWIRIPDNSSSAQERLAVLFFAIMAICLTPFGWQAFALAEKRFFALDSAKGLYSPSAYFVAYVFANLPFQIINTYASGLLSYGLAGLRPEGWAIMQFGAILSLQSIIATQLVTGAVWFFSGQDIAFSIASLYVSFSLLINGFYIRVSDMTLSVARGLSWASFNKYSFQALARTELQNRTWASTTCAQQTNPNFLQVNVLCASSSDELLDYYDYKLSVAKATGAMLGFWGLFCLFSYWALLRLRPTR